MQTSRAILLASLAAAASACSVANSTTSGSMGRACSACHGDPNRATDVPLVMAAPPLDLSGSTSPTSLGVGAHQKHLAGGDGTRSFALGFACSECHPVPASIAAHPSGTVVFDFAGKLASQGGRTPIATAATGTCSNVYCHDPGSIGRPAPVWNRPGSVSCGGCHDLPPTTATGHPAVSSALTGCVLCHPDTMKADGSLNVAGGKHVNGVVDAIGHAAGYADPANAGFHGPDAIRFLQGLGPVLQCTSCHGADLAGGIGPSCGACHSNPPAALRPSLDPAFQNGVSWLTNCTFCHGTPSTDATATVLLAAPPRDVSGANTGTKVGAHQKHLGGSALASAFACETCHPVPTGFTIPPATSAHLDGTVEVTPRGAGQASLPTTLGAFSAAAGTCAVYCHGGAAGGPTGGTTQTPAWAGASITACNACHGNTTAGAANPYFPDTGHHAFHMTIGVRCYNCHNSVVSNVATAAAPAIVGPSLHVNGAKDVAFGGSYGSNPSVTGTFSGGSCTVTCHGSQTW